MSSPNQNFMRWLRPTGAPGAKPSMLAKAVSRTTRRSMGLGEFLHSLSPGTDQKLSVLDLGPTSPANINFLTNREMRVYNEDIMRAVKQPEYMVRGEDGSEQLDLDKFFAENLSYPENHFDAILCWDAPDYLTESLVKPILVVILLVF